MDKTLLWTDKKRPLFGKPLSFTTYLLYADRLVIKSGLLRCKTEQIMLYRILDVTMQETFVDRLFGVGTIHICAGDHSAPETDLRWVLNAETVMELLVDNVERVRQQKGIHPREFMD